MGRIDFLLQANLDGVTFQPAKPEGIFFESEAPEFAIKIKPLESGKVLQSKVLDSVEVSEDDMNFLEALTERNLYLGDSDHANPLPYVRSGQELIDGDGKLSDGYRLERELLPVSLKSVCDDAEVRLVDYLTQFLSLLRWNQGFEAPHNIISSAHLYWKVAGDAYHSTPSPSIELTVPATTGIEWEQIDQNEINQLWTCGRKEPLGHELLREAAFLSMYSDRSALLVAYAALEAGLKAHIAKHVENTSWLLETMPSPPLFKIVRNYLAIIHQNNSEVSDWAPIAELGKAIQKMTEGRNVLAHTGHLDESVDISEQINLVKDTLYFLDVLDGCDWAKGLVSAEFRSSLGWPASRHFRASVTIKTGISMDGMNSD